MWPMTHEGNHNFGWDRPLHYRRGAESRLDGIDVYYDFAWFDFFTDGRTQFHHGLSLVRLIRNDCPPGKTAALLLTLRDDVEEHCIETDSDYVVVVNLPRYLAESTADPAATYYARRFGTGLTGVPDIGELTARADVIRAVVHNQLNASLIADWASSSSERIEQLRAIAGSEDTSRPMADLRAAIEAVQTLETLDADVVTALAALLSREIDLDARIQLLMALTQDDAGRYATSEVLGERIGDRLSDARNVTTAYTALLDSPDSTETDLQLFIENSPWLLGLDYVNVRPRKALPRGAMDFILERFDGFHDLLELKSPQDPVITAPDEVDGVPPPASAFALSPDLANALAQVHVFRDILTADAQTVDKLYGLQNARAPRVIIVIGQARALPPHRSRVLRDLNLSLHHVEIAPYDVLAGRATTALDNVELHLAAARREETDAG
jgi:hypothetical protein